MKKHLLTVCCILILFSVRAQVKGNPEFKGIPQKPVIDKSSSKVSSELKKLYNNYTVNARKAAPTDTEKPALPKDALSKHMLIQGNMVLVDITVKGDAKVARAELEKVGLKVTGVFGRVISGMLPIDAMPQLESAMNVRFVRPAYRAVHRSDPVNASKAGVERGNKVERGNNIMPVISQGDTAQRSYLVRQRQGNQTYTINGEGVKIGILSDSYDNLGTAATGVANGELPGLANPLGFNKPVRILQELESGGTDEGRGMAEIVHDVAPGSEIAFHSAFLGQADFAQGIVELALAGCDVIVDDVFYFEEPFFQDGIIAQAVDQVKDWGVTYFSSAGNNSIRSYESDYRASQFEPFGPDFGTAHNFSAPGSAPRYFQPIYIATEGTLTISFQWDQPFASAGGAGAESDLDIYLLDEAGNLVSDFFGASDNIASGDPVEAFQYTNDTKSNTFYLVITKYAGPDPSRLKYLLYGDAAFYLTTPEIPGILAPTLFGHSKAEGAIATAAVFYGDTPAYGVNPPVVEFFSSVGGVPNYFDKQGNRIAPLIRKKPEITAPDGGNTSFFFSDISFDPDPYPNFFGTSAAAPHAAGAAALMIQAQVFKTITPDQIKGLLSANTVDMDNIYTEGFDVGFDFNTGTGLIKVDAAVDAVRFPGIFIKDLVVKAICSSDPATAQSWQIWNPNPFPVQVQWSLQGSSQRGTIEAQPGETIITTTTTDPFTQTLLIVWKDNFEFSHFGLAYSNQIDCNRYVITENNSGINYKNVVEGNEENRLSLVQVDPNPSVGNFRVSLSFANKENVDLELYGIDGKMLYRMIAPANGTIYLNASGYKPGTYILKARQGTLIKTVKLIRQ